MLQRMIKCWNFRLQTITLPEPDRMGIPDAQVLVSTRVFPGHASANRVIWHAKCAEERADENLI
jgi:hypothetical protein